MFGGRRWERSKGEGVPGRVAGRGGATEGPTEGEGGGGAQVRRGVQGREEEKRKKEKKKL